MRYKDRPCIFWIDAICINQNDVAERDHEVRRMAKIYKLADRVVVWLGLGDTECANGLSSLGYLGEQVELTKDIWLFDSLHTIERDWYHEPIGLPYSGMIWKSIHNLPQRPWFKRLCVFQEVQVANERALVQSGPVVIKLSRLATALAILYIKKKLPTTLFHSQVNTAWNMVGNNGMMLFPFLVKLAQRRICSDPRGKIYAHFGLISDDFAGRIRPAYDKSVADVYRATFLAYFQYSHRFDIMIDWARNNKIMDCHRGYQA
jgi:heterokaryon incompatibility protein (HET)